MGHKTTDQSLIEVMLKQCAAHGFSPFHVRTSSMGYIYNRYTLFADHRIYAMLTWCRIWAAIKRESLLAASEGAGTPEEIDAIFKGVLKTDKGPFELMDLVGLDVVYDIEQHYASARKDIPAEPRNFMQEYLNNGHLGVKTGRGFYNYEVGNAATTTKSEAGSSA